jgi:hypothetical protein
MNTGLSAIRLIMHKERPRPSPVAMYAFIPWAPMAVAAAVRHRNAGKER